MYVKMFILNISQVDYEPIRPKRGRRDSRQVHHVVIQKGGYLFDAQYEASMLLSRKRKRSKRSSLGNVTKILVENQHIAC